jgi:hypothetical protein
VASWSAIDYQWLRHNKVSNLVVVQEPGVELPGYIADLEQTAKFQVGRYCLSGLFGLPVGRSVGRLVVVVPSGGGWLGCQRPPKRPTDRPTDRGESEK